MFCSKCGTQIAEGARFCPRCSAPVSRRSTTSRNPMTNADSLSLTFVEDGQVVASQNVSLTRDAQLTFGRAKDNDLVVSPPSMTVSEHHGRIVVSRGQLVIVDDHSTNGLYYGGTRRPEVHVTVGDVVTIGQPKLGETRTIIIVGDGDKRWSLFDLSRRMSASVGRTPDNDLCIPNPTVSAAHALLNRDQQGAWHITDRGSSNGTRLNGRFVAGSAPLSPGSVLMLGNAQVVFLGTCLLVMTERQGVEVVAEGLVRYRVNKGVRRITTNHVSLRIRRGDFVAIVGGSGCGKSTLLNELNGSEPADEGAVTLDGTDLYANFEMLKSSIGYVPQQDIVYDNLRLEEMLAYAAKLRMQPDTTAEERAARVDEVISLLELDGERQNLIGRLSGGQKKRASIAVELLADPRLLFLDEPTSGLDPGIERKLMRSLADMAHDGRTIILVTHTTLNLHLCDQVVFLGAGGRLCYAGDPAGAMSFFGVSDFVEVYPKIDQDPERWERKFASDPRHTDRNRGVRPSTQSSIGARKRTSFFRQFGTLSARYAKLLINDYMRLALMVFQAPLLAGLINLVAASGVFSICEDTKFYLFALSCAAFWVGIFNSIQEICKENSIFTRECDGGLRIGAYLASKVFVLAVLCLVQTVLLVLVLIVSMGTPKHTLVLAPWFELIVSTYLTVLSAMSLGLLVSALFHSPDKALAMAPILIMPQILFSGIAFELNDVTEKVSYAINCRWAIEALGTTADLNELDLAIYGEEIVVAPERRKLEDQTIPVPATTVEVDMGEPMGKQMVDVPAEDRHFDEIEVDVPEVTKVVDEQMLEHEPDDMFEHSVAHLLTSWGVLLGMSLLCIAGCFVTLALSMRK